MRCSGLTDDGKLALQVFPVRADPRVRQLGVLVLASEEVKKIHGETGQHQNLQVEALPVGSQVQWHLRMYVHVYGNTWPPAAAL